MTTNDTDFAITSIGKPITAASAMMLVEDGVLEDTAMSDEFLRLAFKQDGGQ